MQQSCCKHQQTAVGLDLQTTCYRHPACFLSVLCDSLLSKRCCNIPARTLSSSHTCASQNRPDSLSACVLRSDTARLAATRVRHYFFRSYDTKNDNKTVYRASGSLVILTTSLLSCLSEGLFFVFFCFFSCWCTRSQASPCNATCSPSVLTCHDPALPPHYTELGDSEYGLNQVMHTLSLKSCHTSERW